MPAHRCQPGTFRHIPEVLQKAEEGTGTERAAVPESHIEGFSHRNPPYSRQGWHCRLPHGQEWGRLKEAPSVRPAAVTPSGTQPHTQNPQPRSDCGPSRRHPSLQPYNGSRGISTGLPPGSPSTPGSAASRSPSRAPTPLSPAERAESFQKHKNTPPLGVEQSEHPSTLREPAPATSTSPASGGVSTPPPRGRMVAPASPPPGGTRALQWRVRRGTSTHTRGPPAMDGSSRPPGGRTTAGAKSRLVPTFARLPPLPGASLRRLPQRRVRASCPGTGGLRPGSAPM